MEGEKVEPAITFDNGCKINHKVYWPNFGNGTICVFDFENTNGMQHVGENRFVPVAKNGEPMLGDGKVVWKHLQSSNVDLAYELTKLIEAQRSFSYSLKMISASDEIETTVNNLR